MSTTSKKATRSSYRHDLICDVPWCENRDARYKHPETGGPLCGAHHRHLVKYGKILAEAEAVEKRRSWNRGLTKETDRRLAKLASDRTGEKNWQYRDGRTEMMREVRARGICEMCGSVAPKRIEVHHLNGDHDDNRMENLIAVCSSCHKKDHYRRLGRNRKGDVGGAEALRPWNEGKTQATEPGLKNSSDWRKGRKREKGTMRWLPRESS